MDVTDIEKRFADHRAKAFITCEETCMCWDIEKLLFLLETTRPTLVAAGTAPRCPRCGSICNLDTDINIWYCPKGGACR